MKASWQASADRQGLEARAGMLQQVRQFFAERGVLEVETPLLSRHSGTDPRLSAMQVSYQAADNAAAQSMYLHTSPEFAMKRLLADGSGPIYQICKVFRNGEAGRRHNPEFSMLEWYQPGFDHLELMDEVEALMTLLLGTGRITRITYRELFGQYLDIDPFRISLADLATRARERLDVSMQSDERDTWLDLLYSHLIEPQLQDACFITEFPASQAALAKVLRLPDGTEVAQRFELVIGGLEIANGYHELNDVAEQARRFGNDLAQRKARKLPQYPLDEHLLAALAHGLPDCAGVAVGLDRVLMLRCGATSIDEVLAFPFERA